jgi:hypothetical protein
VVSVDVVDLDRILNGATPGAPSSPTNTSVRCGILMKQTEITFTKVSLSLFISLACMYFLRALAGANIDDTADRGSYQVEIPALVPPGLEL